MPSNNSPRSNESSHHCEKPVPQLYSGNVELAPLFFPEKREFFQENVGMFDFGSGDPRPELRLFHSRRIGLSERREPIDIIAGIKLTGQLAGLDLGFMNMQTDDFAGEPGSNFTVLRSMLISTRFRAGRFRVSSSSAAKMAFGADAIPPWR